MHPNNAQATWLAPDSGRRLSGDLDDWPLLDLLTWLHDCQRSGILRIHAGADDGLVFFSSGALYRCRWGELQGEAALEALLRVAIASFVLVQIDPSYILPNIDTPTEILLPECRDPWQRITPSAA